MSRKQIFTAKTTINHASYGPECDNAKRFISTGDCSLLAALWHSARSQTRLFKESGVNVKAYECICVQLCSLDTDGSVTSIIEQEWDVPVISDAFMPDLEALRTVLTYDTEWDCAYEITDEDRANFKEHCDGLSESDGEEFVPCFQTRTFEVNVFK